MATYAQEKAAKLKTELDRPFKATHNYQPGLMDRASPTVVHGQAIEPGVPVQVLREHTRGLRVGKSVSPFKVVRDEHGNRQHVWKQALVNRTSDPSDAGTGMLISELLPPEREPKQRVFNDRRKSYGRP